MPLTDGCVGWPLDKHFEADPPGDIQGVNAYAIYLNFVLVYVVALLVSTMRVFILRVRKNRGDAVKDLKERVK